MLASFAALFQRSMSLQLSAAKASRLFGATSRRPCRAVERRVPYQNVILITRAAADQG